MSDFAQNLDRLLRTRGAAAKLSMETGLNERSIGGWRKGESQPTLDNIVKMCEYFQMSADDLIGIDKDFRASAPRQPTEREALVQEIAGVLSGLSVEKLKALREFLGSW